MNGNFEWRCPRCDRISHVRLKRRKFRNETTHVEARCGLCYAFIKWVPKLPAVMVELKRQEEARDAEYRTLDEV